MSRRTPTGRKDSPAPFTARYPRPRLLETAANRRYALDLASARSSTSNVDTSKETLPAHTERKSSNIEHPLQVGNSEGPVQMAPMQRALSTSETLPGAVGRTTRAASTEVTVAPPAGGVRTTVSARETVQEGEGFNRSGIDLTLKRTTGFTSKRIDCSLIIHHLEEKLRKMKLFMSGKKELHQLMELEHATRSTQLGRPERPRSEGSDVAPVAEDTAATSTPVSEARSEGSSGTTASSRVDDDSDGGSSPDAAADHDAGVSSARRRNVSNVASRRAELEEQLARSTERINVIRAMLKELLDRSNEIIFAFHQRYIPLLWRELHNLRVRKKRTQNESLQAMELKKQTYQVLCLDYDVMGMMRRERYFWQDELIS